MGVGEKRKAKGVGQRGKSGIGERKRWLCKHFHKMLE